MKMVNKEEFLNENYDNFKTALETIIENFQSGKYITSHGESKIPFKNLLTITGGNPQDYLDSCSLQKFLKDIYNFDYVKNILQWAKEHNFSLVFPEEMKGDYDMDTFAISVMWKKSRGNYNVNDFFTMTFVKEKKLYEGGSMSYIVTIPLLEKNKDEYIVKDVRHIISGINRMEADLL